MQPQVMQIVLVALGTLACDEDTDQPDAEDSVQACRGHIWSADYFLKQMQAVENEVEDLAQLAQAQGALALTAA